MTRLRRLAGRVAALALAAVCIVVLWAGVILPVADHVAELDEEKRLAAASIIRLSARVRDRDGFAERLAALKREVGASDLHIRAATPALGTAVMQRLLAEAAARHGVEVASTQALPGTTEAGFERILLRADVAGEYPAVVALLHELESGRPYIFIDGLTMRLLPAMAAAGAPVEHPVVTVELGLAAYMKEPEA